MFLIMGLVLAVGSTYSEVKLVHGVPFVRRLYVDGLKTPWGHVEGVIFNTIGSFALSYLIGIMFAAEGVTVLFGGMLSTAFSQMYFSWEGYAKSMGWSIQGTKDSIRKGVTSVQNAKSSVVKTYRDFEQPLKDLRRGILIALRIITMPFVWLRAMSKWYTERKAVA